MSSWSGAIAQFLLAACVLGLSMRADAARPWIDMGVKDDFAFDQPAISFELLENDGSGVSLGPSGGSFFGLTNRFILDTGATSIIAMNDAEAELQQNGYVTENTVLEQGVAGFSVLDVSAPYTVKLTDSAGADVLLPSTRIMSEQFPDLFGVNGVVGMPGMVGRVVTLDETVWADIEDIFDILPLDVRLSNSLPASNGHRYSVPIHAKRFEVEGDPPLPTSSPIPLLEMSLGFGGLDATGTFALDTGAAISFISTEIAAELGLDSNGDGEFGAGDEQNEGTLPIGGIGGTIEAPVFLIDRFSVATEQGVDLVWNLESLLSVLVVDIHPDIDGVLGSDLLTSGWVNLDIILGGGGESMPGPIEYAHFDFRQFSDDGDTGKVFFDLTPSFDVVQPGAIAGDYNSDGNVDAADYTLWQDTLGTTGAGLAADGDGDGTIDAGDYTVWKNSFGMSAPASATGSASGATGSASAGAAVPEPTSLVLLLVGALAITPRARSAAWKRRESSCSS